MAHRAEHPGTLRRELSVWEAIGLSLALMAPSMAANINPQATAGTVGRAVPLAFLLATLGVLLIAYTFVRLCQRFHHAGSVYGFVGATLGARAGVVAGWSLLGTYVFYGVVTSTAAGIFGAAALDSLGIWPDQPPWAGFVVAAVALLLVLVLAIVRVRGGTRVLLTIEGLTVALILVVAVVVLVRLATGTAPGGRGVDLSVFTPAPGTDGSALFLGIVFGFLSFAGFEAAATLGEETRDPRRTIPRAILGVAIFGGVYFVFVTAVEVMGFGADDAGVAAFTKSPSLMGDLGTSYVAAWVGDVITIGAAVSAFGCALACAVGAARLLFALGRDGVLPRSFGAVAPDRGTPVPATVVVVLAHVPRDRRGLVRPRRRPVHALRGFRHHRHPDPARRLRARHGRRGQAAVLLGHPRGAGRRGRHPRARPRPDRLHALPQRLPLPGGGGGAVPGGLGGVDRRGRAGGAAAAGCRPTRGRRADRERGPHR